MTLTVLPSAMYVVLVGGGRRLITSNAEVLRIHELGDVPRLIAEVEQPGERPFFEQSVAGERLCRGGGLVARSFTPRGRDTHWTETPTSVGLYRDEDLATVAVLDLGRRLDHESLALSPDGRVLASVSRGAGAIAFDASTGTQLWQVDGRIASGPSWSPDGRYLALGETDQGGGELTLIDTRPEGGGSPSKHLLPPPESGVGLYDSPFRSLFSSDGRWVVFTSASWGMAGISAYEVSSQTERWSTTTATTDEEESEQWSAPEVDLALDDTLLLVGQDGVVQAFGAADGTERSALPIDEADGRWFAADSTRRGVWLTRGGQPTFVAFPDDWR